MAFSFGDPSIKYTSLRARLEKAVQIHSAPLISIRKHLIYTGRHKNVQRKRLNTKRGMRAYSVENAECFGRRIQREVDINLQVNAAAAARSLRWGQPVPILTILYKPSPHTLSQPVERLEDAPYTPRRVGTSARSTEVYILSPVVADILRAKMLVSPRRRAYYPNIFFQLYSSRLMDFRNTRAQRTYCCASRALM